MKKPIPANVREYLRWLGQRGGSVKSEKKTAAVRANILKAHAAKEAARVARRAAEEELNGY